MPGTLNAAPRDPLLGDPKGPLKLRLRNSNRAGQVLQLHAPKVAIGSSPRCTLRIRTSGILPVHCLIVRGTQHTLIRRVSGDTRLNDAAFDDAILQTGDRLGIGPLELEVIEDQARRQNALNTEPTPADVPINSPDADSFNPTVGSSSPLAPPLLLDSSISHAEEFSKAQVGAVRRHSHRRVRLLVHQLRLMRGRNRELEHLAVCRQEESKEIDRRWAELENDIQSFVNERQRWQDVRAQNERLLVWRREQLDEQLHLPSTERQAIAGERADLVEHQNQFAQQLAELERRQLKLDDDQCRWREQEHHERELLDRQSRELSDQAASLIQREERLAAAESNSSSQFSSELAELNSLKDKFEDERQTWEAQSPQWESKQAKLTADLDRLNSEKQQFKMQQAAWEAQRSQQAAELQERDRKLNDERSELAAQRNEIAQSEPAHSESQNDLTKLQEALAQQQAEFETREQALRLEFEKRENDFRSHQEEFTLKEQEFSAEREKLAARLAALEAEDQQRRLIQADLEAQLRQATDALEHGEALAQQKAEFETRELALRSEFEKREVDFRSQQEQFALKEQESVAEREKLAARLAALEAEEQQRQLTQADQETQLRQATNALEQSKARLADEKASWEAERTQQEANFTTRSEELEQHGAEIECQREELQRLREELAASDPPATPRDAAPESALPASAISAPTEELNSSAPEDENPPATAPSAGTTSDEEEVFARLRALSLLKKDAADPADAEADLAPTSVAKRSAENHSEPTAGATEGSSEPPAEESIDDYMGRLLQRMRGIAGEASSTPAPAKNDRSSPSRPKEHPEATPTKSTEESSTIAKKLLKLEPRKVAPEKIQGLAAMREIANLSARSAIATHHHRRGASRAWSNLVVGFVGLGCGVWLLIQSPETDSPFFYGGLMGLVVSVYWFAKVRLLARSMRSSKRHNQQQFAAMSREQSAPNPKTDDNAVGKGDSDTSNK